MKLLIQLLLVIMMTGYSINSHFDNKFFAQDNQYQLEVALIYKLSKFVHWPSQIKINKMQNFGICVLGNKKLAKALSLLEKRQIKSRPIKIHAFNFSKQRGKHCQVLFIDTSRKPFLKFIFNEIKGMPSLTMSSLKGFAKSGGMIDFSVENKVLKFNINNKVVKTSGLSINSALLNMSTLISEE